MGVDISLFAKNAKIQFIADRARVVSNYSDLDLPRHDELLGKAWDYENGISKSDMVELLTLSKLAHEENCKKYEGENASFEYEHYWLDAMIAFVERHPHDIFFLLTDHHGAYYDISDNYIREHS